MPLSVDDYINMYKVNREHIRSFANIIILISGLFITIMGTRSFIDCKSILIDIAILATLAISIFFSIMSTRVPDFQLITTKYEYLDYLMRIFEKERSYSALSAIFLGISIFLTFFFMIIRKC